MAGYGGMPRAKAATKHKQTTKATFVYTCDICNKAHVKAFSRIKKANLV
jgi:ribosomal protein L44E